jgi:hypothetical protein
MQGSGLRWGVACVLMSVYQEMLWCLPRKDLVESWMLGDLLSVGTLDERKRSVVVLSTALPTIHGIK